MRRVGEKIHRADGQRFVVLRQTGGVPRQSGGIAGNEQDMRRPQAQQMFPHGGVHTGPRRIHQRDVEAAGRIRSLRQELPGIPGLPDAPAAERGRIASGQPDGARIVFDPAGLGGMPRHERPGAPTPQ